MQTPIITVFDLDQKSFYVDIVKKAFVECSKYNSKLPQWILSIDGMSGKKYRHFINNLVEFIPDCRYLEIGSWIGSTLCSALYKNNVEARSIEDWSFGISIKELFEENLNRCINESLGDSNIKFELKETSYLNVDYSKIGKYNLYLFDGPHEAIDQYNALTLVIDALDDEFIFICDDWNWIDVREATKKSIEDLNLNVLYSMEIRSTSDNSHPPDEYSRGRGDWHNGYYISVLKK